MNVIIVKEGKIVCDYMTLPIYLRKKKEIKIIGQLKLTPKLKIRINGKTI